MTKLKAMKQEIIPEEEKIKIEEIEKLALILKIDENSKLFFLNCAGLELSVLRLIKNPNLITILQVYNDEKSYIIALNNLKAYNKMVRILFNRNEELVIEELTMKNLKLFLSILEDASQTEEVRKTIADMKRFEDYFRVALENPALDISKQTVIDEPNSAIILMHFYTFICNICFTSDIIRDRIASKYDEIMKQVFAFFSIYNFNSTLHTNILESVLALVINLSCDVSFREKLKKSDVFIKHLIDVLKKVATPANYEKLADLYEKSLSMLYNLTHKDELNSMLIQNDLPKNILKYFNLMGSLDKCLVDKKKTLPLLRTIMMIGKLAKTEVLSFIQDNEFLKKITALISLKVLNDNQQILEETYKALAHILIHKNFKENSKENVSKYFGGVNFDKLAISLSEILAQDYQTLAKNKDRVSNNLSVSINIVNTVPGMAKIFARNVKIFVDIASNQIETLRKNACVILARLAKCGDDSVYAIVKENHGIDVLMNVAKFIK